MNRFAVSLIWIIITAAACYGVIVGYNSLNSKPIDITTNSNNVLTQNLAQTDSEREQIIQEESKEDEKQDDTSDTILNKEFTVRVTALPQEDFDRLIRRLDDLIGSSVTIKKGSMGKRVSEFKEVVNLVLNKNLSITKEGEDQMILQVNELKNYFKLPEDSLADKALYEALKRVLLDARNS